jgi:hypothetical protein
MTGMAGLVAGAMSMAVAVIGLTALGSKRWAGTRLLTSGLVLNLLTDSLDVMSDAMHGVATAYRAQHAQQHQCCQNSLNHDHAPGKFSR